MMLGRLILSFILLILSFNLDASDLIDEEEIIQRLGDRMALTSYRMNRNWSLSDDGEDHIDIKTDSWDAAVIGNQRRQVTSLGWNFVSQPFFSKALEELLNSYAVIEPDSAIRLMCMALTHLVIGDKGMYTLAWKTYASIDLQIPADIAIHLISLKLSTLFFDRSTSKNQQSFLVHKFINHPFYDVTTPESLPKSYPVMKLPDGDYLGFMPGFLDTPRSKHELEQHYYNEMTTNLDFTFNSSEDLNDDKLLQEAFNEAVSFEKFQHDRNIYAKNLERVRLIKFFSFDLKAALQHKEYLDMSKLTL